VRSGDGPWLGGDVRAWLGRPPPSERRCAPRQRTPIRFEIAARYHIAESWLCVVRPRDEPFDMLRRCTTPLLRSVRVPQLAAAAARPSLLSAARRREMSTFEAADDIDVDSVSYGFMASQAIFTGLELGLFEAIAGAGEQGVGLPALQEACGVAAPRLQTLLTSLTAIKSVRRTADGTYTLSPNSSKYLVESSRAYYGDYLRYQMGRQFYHRMGALPDVMATGVAPSYASWFSDPETANTYTQAQHNGSVATAKYMVKKKLSLEGVTSMLDVGGGSGAFSYVFTGVRHAAPLSPMRCRSGGQLAAAPRTRHAVACAQPKRQCESGRARDGVRWRPCEIRSAAMRGARRRVRPWHVARGREDERY
jgi:hypothetical protein